MYDQKSAHAEEFIDHQEILDSLAYADVHRRDAAVIDAVLEKGLTTGRLRFFLPVNWKKKIRRSMRWRSRSKRIFTETVL